MPDSAVVQVGCLRTARLRQLSRKRRGRRRHPTVKLAALLLAAAGLGCDTTTTVCGGIATCYSTQASRCGNPQGCTATPVCMTDPSFGQDCALATTQDDCLVNVTAKFCVWSNGVCSGPCTQALDMATCSGHANLHLVGLLGDAETLQRLFCCFLPDLRPRRLLRHDLPERQTVRVGNRCRASRVLGGLGSPVAPVIQKVFVGAPPRELRLSTCVPRSDNGS